MSTVVGLVVPARELALEGVLSAVPDAEIEIEPTLEVFSPDHRTVIRATCEEFDRLDRAIRADESTDNVELLASFEGAKWLYGAELRPEEETALPLLTAANATVLRARSTDRTWTVRMLFPDRETLSTLYEACRESGSSVGLEWVHGVNDTDDIRRSSGTDLTPRQRRALATAHRLGYYDIPRGATGEEVAEVLGISHQALSELLCRGHRNLVDGLFGEEEPKTPFVAAAERRPPLN